MKNNLGVVSNSKALSSIFTTYPRVKEIVNRPLYNNSIELLPGLYSGSYEHISLLLNIKEDCEARGYKLWSDALGTISGFRKHMYVPAPVESRLIHVDKEKLLAPWVECFNKIFVIDARVSILKKSHSGAPYFFLGDDKVEFAHNALQGIIDERYEIGTEPECDVVIVGERKSRDNPMKERQTYARNKIESIKTFAGTVRSGRTTINLGYSRSRPVNGYPLRSQIPFLVALAPIKSLMSLPATQGYQIEDFNSFFIKNKIKTVLSYDIKQFDNTIPLSCVEFACMALLYHTNIDYKLYLRQFYKPLLFRRNAQYVGETLMVGDITKGMYWAGNRSGIAGTSLINTLIVITFIIFPLLEQNFSIEFTGMNLWKMLTLQPLETPHGKLYVFVTGDDICFMTDANELHLNIEQVYEQYGFRLEEEAAGKNGYLFRQDEGVVKAWHNPTSYVGNLLCRERDIFSKLNPFASSIGLALRDTVYRLEDASIKPWFNTLIKKYTGKTLYEHGVFNYNDETNEYITGDDALDAASVVDYGKYIWHLSDQELVDKYGTTLIGFILPELVREFQLKYFKVIR